MEKQIALATWFQTSRSRKTPPLFKLWLVFFAYTAAVAFLVQFVILPHWIPNIHAGHGLLIGADSVRHHSIAVELAKAIKTEGWSAWQLRPEGQAPAGIAGAVYALTVPEPWTMIPINAALHALAVVLLLQIVRVFIPNWRWAIWSTLPFLLYPSAMLWYTQLMKDSFSIAGSLAFLYGLLCLAHTNLFQLRWKTWLKAVFFIVLGSLLAWIVRPYVVQIFQGIAALVALLLTGVWLVQVIKHRKHYAYTAVNVLSVWILLYLLSPFTTGGIEADLPPPAEGQEAVQLGKLEWNYSSWIPYFIEAKLFNLADVRRGFVSTYLGAKSNIDADVAFHRASDIIAYLPRSVQIAFLAPFPFQWFLESSLKSTQLMRYISGVEMIGIYAALLFLVYALWKWRFRLETWVILIFSSSAITILGLSIPNIGTLYRMRYGFLMTLVAVGLAAGINAWQERHQSPKLS